MGNVQFTNLTEAREMTLISLYEKIYDMGDDIGSEDFLKASQSISNLEKVMSETYKADSEYESKLKVSELDAETKKHMSTSESETKLKIAELDSDTKTKLAKMDEEIKYCDFDTKEKIANIEAENKVKIAELDAETKKVVSKKDVESKKEIATIEADSKSKESKTERNLRIIETGAKVALVGLQLIIFTEELSKSRKFEETGVEVTSAFRKVWNGFKPFNM